LIGKQFFRRTDMNNPGAEEGTMELVGLSKIPMILECKRFFESMEPFTPGFKEVAVNLVRAT
jgi:hypothetical protein